MKKTKTFIIENEDGLHMRPAAKLVQIAKTFESEITFFSNGLSANSNSIMSLLMLGAAKGAALTVTADGIDATAALCAIKQTSGLINE